MPGHLLLLHLRTRSCSLLWSSFFGSGELLLILCSHSADKQCRASNAASLTTIPVNHHARTLSPSMRYILLLWRSIRNLLFQFLQILGLSCWWIHFRLVLTRYPRRRIDHVRDR